VASWFVVIEFNQASHQPDSSQQLELFDSLAEAREIGAVLLRENRARGRRETYRIYELEEIEATDD
jgi:hypothetical protein